MSLSLKPAKNHPKELGIGAILTFDLPILRLESYAGVLDPSGAVIRLEFDRLEVLHRADSGSRYEKGDGLCGDLHYCDFLVICIFEVGISD